MRDMINEGRDGYEIDLQKLLLSYLQKWWLIVLCGALVGASAWYITKHHITPMYEAKVMVYVNNNRGDLQIDTITNANLATAQRLVDTYINIIKSDTVLEKVAEESHLNLSATAIRKIMSAEQVDDTELFNVIITYPDPKIAAQVANAVAEVAPGEIENFVEGSSTKIIDYAKIPQVPSSPNVSRNVVLGVLLGVVGALLYLTIRFLLDVRIKDEEDLNMLFEFPVLAQIPAFVTDSSKRRSGYGKNAYEHVAAGEERKAK